MQVGPTYGAVVTARGNCSADGDCLSSAGLICLDQVCRSQRRFRFKPHAVSHAHFVRISILEAERFNRNGSRCGPLHAYLTRSAPYPDGDLVDTALVPVNGTAGCGSVYTLTLASTGCGGLESVGPSGEQSRQRCSQPVDASAHYYVVVRAAGTNGMSTSLSIRVLSATRESESASSLFGSLADIPRKTPASTGADRSGPSNISKLELGQVVYGQSALGEASYYSVTVQDERSELMCVAGASSGTLMLFMSTSDQFPSRLQSRALQWRSDTNGVGTTTAKVLARPTDDAFRIGEFYLAVHGDSAAAFNLTCNVSTVTHVPSVRVGGVFGGQVTPGGYTFFRLPVEAHYQLVVFTARLSDVGPTYTNPALALYLQTAPSSSASTLGACGRTTPASDCLVPASTNSSCPMCGYPFATDEAAMEHPEYLGTTLVQARLRAGSVYYVAVASQSQAARFSLSIQST